MGKTQSSAICNLLYGAKRPICYTSRRPPGATSVLHHSKAQLCGAGLGKTQSSVICNLLYGAKRHICYTSRRPPGATSVIHNSKAQLCGAGLGKTQSSGICLCHLLRSEATYLQLKIRRAPAAISVFFALTKRSEVGRVWVRPNHLLSVNMFSERSDTSVFF